MKKKILGRLKAVWDRNYVLILALLAIFIVLIANWQMISVISMNTLFTSKMIIAKYDGQKIELPEHSMKEQLFTYEDGHRVLSDNYCQIFDGEWVKIAETEICTNSFGMRDREFNLTKMPGVLRIAAIGDSYTFGWGVNLSDSWPKQLEKKLNDNGIKAEVLNFGVPGYNLDDMMWIIEKKASKFHLDIMIVTFANDDFRDARKLEEFKQKRIRELVKDNSKLDIETITAIGSRKGLEDEMSIESSMDPGTFKERLNQSWTTLQNLSEGMNASLIVPIISEFDNQKEGLQQISHNLGIKIVVIDLYDATKYDQEKISVNLKDGHFNALGNDIVAEKLLPALNLTQH
jgi:lysophospholipase L1-like esterase